MKKVITIIILLLVYIFVIGCGKYKELGAIREFSVNDTLNESNNEKIRVILLYGQSNASGCSHSSYLQKKDFSTYEKASKGFDNVYINYICENGSNSSNNEFVKCGLGNGASKDHFGPEVGIGLTYQEAGLKCFIIKYSWGGSVLDNQWMNGKYKRGELYEAAINFTKASLDYLTNKGYKYTIDGICWMQGESDAGLRVDERYYKNTKEFVSFLRKDLSSYQETIDFIDAGISDSALWVEYKNVNKAKIEYSNESDHNYFINTIEAGLHYDQEPVETPDIAHYDSESEIILGKLFAGVLIHKTVLYFS